MNRKELLNTLIDVHGYHSYLEIGVERGNIFWHVKAFNRTCVDPEPKLVVPFTNVPIEFNGTNHVTDSGPNIEWHAYKMTSHAFFHQNKRTYDLIFIDGLHHAQACYIDMLDALRVLNPGGTIVCHDMLPKKRIHQVVPRDSVQWTGDVWKAWMHLRTRREDLRMAVLKDDWGCGIIQRGQQEKVDLEGKKLNWRNFKNNQLKWMNVVTEIPKEFLV